MLYAICYVNVNVNANVNVNVYVYVYIYICMGFIGIDWDLIGFDGMYWDLGHDLMGFISWGIQQQWG